MLDQIKKLGPKKKFGVQKINLGSEKKNLDPKTKFGVRKQNFGSGNKILGPKKNFGAYKSNISLLLGLEPFKKFGMGGWVVVVKRHLRVLLKDLILGPS